VILRRNDCRRTIGPERNEPGGHARKRGLDPAGAFSIGKHNIRMRTLDRTARRRHAIVGKPLAITRGE